MLRAALLAVVGLGAAAPVFVAAASDEPRSLTLAQSTAAETTPGLEELRPAVAPADPLPPARVDRRIRDVTPPGITAGPAVTGPLLRLAPVRRPAAPEPVKGARSERLFRPDIRSAGLLVARNREVRLVGVKALEPEQTCGEGVATWPCGRMARAALRRFVRGRAIECDIPAGAPDIPDPARCHVAGDDLSKWLVAQGWAPRDGNLYSEIEAAARDGKRGIWGEARPGGQPDLAAARASASAPDNARPMSDRVSGIP